ncbi:MAG TPA: phosphohydrolase [Microbacteriaceae bacterium]|nr:phosphohydrolase [Microbacteriaceae bacterium]
MVAVGRKLVAKAELIATEAHYGQNDKAGFPFIDHPRRVAARFDASRQSFEAATAWLHDVLEDTSLTADDLREEGIPEEVVCAVEALTEHRNPSDREAFYERIRSNPLALVVKAAIVADHTDPMRLAHLPEEIRAMRLLKYADASIALGLEDAFAPDASA